MSFVAAALIGGAALSAGGSYLSARQASKGKYNTDPYGQLSPEQRSMMQSLGPSLTGLATGSPQLYGGQYAANMTPGEQEVLNRDARLAAMTEGWSGNYQPGYINPEVNATEWQNLNRNFYGNGIYPGAKALAEEQYAGSGGYWGTPRANAVMNEYNAAVVNPYQNIRSNLLQNSYQNALNYAQGQSAQNAASESLQAIPRLIKQYGLGKQYEEWTRGSAEKQKYIDQALAFMNIGSATTTYQPAGPSAWGSALSGLGSAVSTYGMLQGLGGLGSSGSNPANQGISNADKLAWQLKMLG